MNKMIITFSGREKKGNCESIADFITNHEDKNYRKIKFSGLSIHPCSDCNYECFDSETCFYDDGMKELFNEMMNSNELINIIPMYNGFTSSHYIVFKERLQGLMKEPRYREFEKLEKKYIIIGNLSSGVQKIIDWIISEEQIDCSSVLLLESTKYKMSSIKDLLIDNLEVQEEVRAFIK